MYKKKTESKGKTMCPRIEGTIVDHFQKLMFKYIKDMLNIL